uniref:Uncharacterized protein n=1 Tax=Salarias fasciatus TaxID=181472 RepID=A0A672HML6_SALFA
IETVLKTILQVITEMKTQPAGVKQKTSEVMDEGLEKGSKNAPTGHLITARSILLENPVPETLRHLLLHCYVIYYVHFPTDPSMTVRDDIIGRYSNRLYGYEAEDVKLLLENMKKAKKLLKFSALSHRTTPTSTHSLPESTAAEV